MLPFPPSVITSVMFRCIPGNYGSANCTDHHVMIANELLLSDNVTSVYTSGRKCNFQNKGCDAPHLAPIIINGWFWAGANNARIPPTNRPAPGEAFWSTTGE